jgi:Dolichyl-phosphate-mannose-protein mannosyltransferase
VSGFTSGRRWLLLSAPALGVLAALSARSPSALLTTLALWISAAAALLLAAGGAERAGPPVARRFLLVAALLLVVSVPFRTIGLEAVPPDVHGDEAEGALQALSLHAGGSNPFGLGWYELPIPGYWLQGIGMELFGPSLRGYRGGAALVAILGLLGHVVCMCSLFGPEVALVSLAPLLTYHWHLQLSRQGLVYVQATLFATWAIGIFGMARNRASPRLFALSGLVAGLGCLTYPGARIVPLILGAFALTELATGLRRRRFAIRNHLWIGLGFLVGLAPLFPILIGGWDAYMARSYGVTIWAPENARHLSAGFQTTALARIIPIHAARILGVFLPGGRDTSGQYGFEGSFVDPWLCGLAVAGLLYSLRCFAEAPYRLLVLWFVLTCVLGGILTIDAPCMPRLSAIATLPYTFAAISITRAACAMRERFGRPGGAAAWTVAVLLLCASVAWNYAAYFHEYPKQRPASEVTVLAREIGTLGPDVQVRMLLSPRIYWGHATLQYLNPGRPGKDVTDLEEELRSPAGTPRAFVLFVDQAAELDGLRRTFPSGRLIETVRSNGILIFLAPGTR